MSGLTGRFKALFWKRLGARAIGAQTRDFDPLEPHRQPLVEV